MEKDFIPTLNIRNKGILNSNILINGNNNRNNSNINNNGNSRLKREELT